MINARKRLHRNKEKRDLLCITADIFVTTVNTRIVLVIAVQLTVLQYGLIILHLLVKHFFVRQKSISGC